MLRSPDVSIDTARLTLRALTRNDLPFFARIHADPNVARYLGHGMPRTEQETSEWLSNTLEWYGRVGRGALAAVRKSDGVLLGRCGINRVEIEKDAAEGTDRRAFFGPGSAPVDVGVVCEDELGYTFDPEQWGQGYATEASASMFAYARGKLGLKRIISLIHPDNARSVNVATKQGATRVDQVVMMGLPYDRFVWPN